MTHSFMCYPFRITPLAFNNLRMFNEDMVIRGYIIPAKVSIAYR